MLFREDFVLSERAMEQQQWTVTRRLVGHRGAQRRWDRAYQLLLPAATPHPGPVGGGAPTSAPEESRHASSRLCPGIAQRQAQAQTAEQQLERLRAHAATRGWVLPAECV